VEAADAAEPTPLEQAARALDRPGAVRYWTDYLKVCRLQRVGRVLLLVRPWSGIDLLMQILSAADESLLF
jgi:hypothetical protein